MHVLFLKSDLQLCDNIAFAHWGIDFKNQFIKPHLRIYLVGANLFIIQMILNLSVVALLKKRV